MQSEQKKNRGCDYSVFSIPGESYDYTESIFCIAGAGDIATDCMKYLFEHKGLPRERLTVSCRRTETGFDGWQKSLRAYAQKNNIKESSLEELYEIENLVFLSVEYDRIVRPNKFASELLYNIHFSALPEYKGMYTSILPILHNKKETGVTFHEIDAGIDTGNLIFQKRFPIESNDTAQVVYGNLVLHGTALVNHAIDMMLDHSVRLRGTPQPYEKSTYYGKNAIDYSNLVIDLKQTAECIHNQIRAYFFPAYQVPSIYGYKVCGSEICSTKTEGTPGTILEDNEQFLRISTIDYDLVVRKM